MRIKTNDNYISMVLKNTYEEIKNEILLSATLQRVYTEKKSIEIINTKLANQVNAMEISINRINPKFGEKKSKSYERIKEEMIQVLDCFEKNLNQFSAIFDKKIEEAILKKVELESKLLIAILLQQKLYKKQIEEDKKTIGKGLSAAVKKIKGKVSKKVSVDLAEITTSEDEQDIEKEILKQIKQSEEYKENRKNMIKFEKEIRNLNKKIDKLSEEKKQKLFEAMETEEKSISTSLRKPKTLGKIKRFFINRFSTEKAIMKNVIEPFRQRIDEFKVNALDLKEKLEEPFDLLKINEKIETVQKDILEDIENKLLCKEIGVIDKF